MARLGAVFLPQYPHVSHDKWNMFIYLNKTKEHHHPYFDGVTSQIKPTNITGSTFSCDKNNFTKLLGGRRDAKLTGVGSKSGVFLYRVTGNGYVQGALQAREIFIPLDSPQFH